MDNSDALMVIKGLAEGVDVTTGEIFEDVPPFNNPKIIRALFKAIEVMEIAPLRNNQTSQGSNRWQPWSDEEEALLVSAFRSGIRPKELAVKHGRTLNAIETRLLRLGLIKQKTT